MHWSNVAGQWSAAHKRPKCNSDAIGASTEAAGLCLGVFTAM
jgi:hypothetical protein